MKTRYERKKTVPSQLNWFAERLFDLLIPTAVKSGRDGT
jgi:hypothetical protein